MQKEYTIIVEQDEDGIYVAECPAFESCTTQGKTIEEVKERIKEVITICIREKPLGSGFYIK